MLVRPANRFMVIDHGERLTQMIILIGRAYLAMLNVLDRADQLKPDSNFEDLGLASGLYMLIPDSFSDAYNQSRLDWKRHVQCYMEGKKIDTSFVHGSPKIDISGETEELDARKGVPKAGPDRWGFKNAVSLSFDSV